MRTGAWIILAAAAVGISAGRLNSCQAAGPFELALPLPWSIASCAADSSPALENEVRPFSLAQVDEPPNVYPEIMPLQQDHGVNSGGVNFGLDVDWLTAYVFRGVNQNTLGHRRENALQFNANATFDLGKLPHPFIGLFVNVFNNDPVSRFEEVRPYFGLDWNLRPFDVMAGFNSYIHPNRKSLDTQEVFLSIAFDDSLVFHSAEPILPPYIYGAYDTDLYKGFYVEAGVKHDFVFEDYGTTLTPHGDIAYVINDGYFSRQPGRSYGLQHFDLGLTGSISLNHFLNVNRRYGEWSVRGYVTYTACIDRQHLRGDTLVWGGAGLEFKY